MKKTIEFYTHTKSEFEKEAVVLKSKSVKLSVFRFAVFLVTCFLVYYNFGNYPIVFTIAFLGTLLFVFLVSKHVTSSNNKKYY